MTSVSHLSLKKSVYQEAWLAVTLHGTQTFVTEVQETEISCQATNPVGLLLPVTLDQEDLKRSRTLYGVKS